MQVQPLTRSEAMACQYIVFVPVSGRIVAATDEHHTLVTACAEIVAGEWDMPSNVIPALRVLDRSDGRTRAVSEVLDMVTA